MSEQRKNEFWTHSDLLRMAGDMLDKDRVGYMGDESYTGEELSRWCAEAADEIDHAARGLKKPDDQFQIGDHVIYVSEGVYTRVSGYVWATSIGNGAPRIVGYQLDCGIQVIASLIERQPGIRIVPAYQRGQQPLPKRNL